MVKCNLCSRRRHVWAKNEGLFRRQGLDAFEKKISKIPMFLKSNLSSLPLSTISVSLLFLVYSYPLCRYLHASSFIVCQFRCTMNQNLNLSIFFAVLFSQYSSVSFQSIRFRQLQPIVNISVQSIIQISLVLSMMWCGKCVYLLNYTYYGEIIPNCTTSRTIVQVFTHPTCVA